MIRYFTAERTLNGVRVVRYNEEGQETFRAEEPTLEESLCRAIERLPIRCEKIAAKRVFSRMGHYGPSINAVETGSSNQRLLELLKHQIEEKENASIEGDSYFLSERGLSHRSKSSSSV